MIVTGTRAGIVAVDAADGKFLWLNDWSANNTANCPTPAYADGHVFWSNGYGKGGVCLKLAKDADGKITAQEAWTTKDMVCHHGGYVILDGHIYGNHSGGWSCLKLDNGEVVWEGRGVGKGSLCYADGLLFLFGERGGQAGLAPCTTEGLSLTGEFSVAGDGPSWAHPVVAGGRLYLRYDTNLYVFDIRAAASDR
jgi:outer membrane protein assembly factor BamB